MYTYKLILLALLIFFISFQVIQEVKPENKIDGLDLWLEELVKYENCPTEGMMDGGSLSFAELCFKKPTFFQFAKQLNVFPNAEDFEIENFLYDKEGQFAVAKAMILDNPRNSLHWKNSVYIGQKSRPPLGEPKL